MTISVQMNIVRTFTNMDMKILVSSVYLVDAIVVCSMICAVIGIKTGVESYCE